MDWSCLKARHSAEYKDGIKRAYSLTLSTVKDEEDNAADRGCFGAIVRAGRFDRNL